METIKPLTTIYAAYGMNTSKDEMKIRCPRAKSLGMLLELEDHQLVFNGVADVVPANGKSVITALWEITSQCERALDRLEGYRGESGLYVKRYIETMINGHVRRVMIYVMNPQRDHRRTPPSKHYENTLRRGYREHLMPQSQIDIAIKLSQREEPSSFLDDESDDRQTRLFKGDVRKPGPVRVIKPDDADYVTLDGKRYPIQGGGK